MPAWRHKNFKVPEQTCEKQLKGVDFIGGTFVEYHRHEDLEFRGKITKFSCIKNSFAIETDKSEATTNFLKLGTPYIRSQSSTIISETNGVWLIDSGPYLGWTFAIAPSGIEIPIRRSKVL